MENTIIKFTADTSGLKEFEEKIVKIKEHVDATLALIAEINNSEIKIDIKVA
jgi:hypothetical protein